MAKTPEQISYNMSRIRSTDTVQENLLCRELYRQGIYSFERHAKDIPGCPDIVFRARRLAVFCDGDFWHGYNWDSRRENIKSRRDYWIPKIERNMVRDKAVTYSLGAQGWEILRFWEHDIKKNPAAIADIIVGIVCRLPQPPYRLAELNAGIGELRSAFEEQAPCVSLLAAESNRQARKVYAHKFGHEPVADFDINSVAYSLSQHNTDVILAHLTALTPSQLRRYKRPPLANGEILTLINRARPCAFLLLGSSKLLKARCDNNALSLVRKLIIELNYNLAGIPWDAEELPKSCLHGLYLNDNDSAAYSNDLIYLLGFDRERVKNAEIFEAELPPADIIDDIFSNHDIVWPDSLNTAHKQRLLKLTCHKNTVRSLVKLMAKCLSSAV